MSANGLHPLQSLFGRRTVRAMDKAFERGDDHAPCTRQLQRGLRRLRFDDPSLEAEFRRRYTDLNIGRIRAAVVLAVVMVLMVAGLDLATAPDMLRWEVFAEKMALLLPVPLITLWVAYHPQHYRHVDRAMFAALISVGFIFAAIHTQMGGSGYIQPHYSLMLVVFYAYFLSALLWPGCVIAAWVATISAIGGDLYVGVPGDQLVYSALHLIAANLVGMVGSYMLERVSRLDYLHAGSASEMADIDRVTSLRSARSFERRLERWCVKAIARRGCVGVMLIDIDYFRRFDARCGHYEAEKALRTIAQGIQGLRSTRECFLARLDDDGFGVIMRDATSDALEALANEVRQAVCDLAIPHPDSPIAPHISVTVVGRVTAPSADLAADAILGEVRADLERIKQCTRNSVWIDGDANLPPDPGKNVTPIRKTV